MDAEQLLTALQSVNINSDSAVKIMEMYIQYQYIEMIVRFSALTIVMCSLFYCIHRVILHFAPSFE